MNDARKVDGSREGEAPTLPPHQRELAAGGGGGGGGFFGRIGKAFGFGGGGGK